VPRAGRLAGAKSGEEVRGPSPRLKSFFYNTSPESCRCVAQPCKGKTVAGWRCVRLKLRMPLKYCTIESFWDQYFRLDAWPDTELTLQAPATPLQALQFGLGNPGKFVPAPTVRKLSWGSLSTAFPPHWIARRRVPVGDKVGQGGRWPNNPGPQTRSGKYGSPPHHRP